MRFGQAVRVLAALLTVALPAAASDVRTLVQELPLQSGQRVHVKLSLGQVLVEPTDEEIVRVTMVLECTKEPEKCQKKLDRIELLMTTSSERLLAEADGLKRSSSGLDVRVTIEVPKNRQLEIDLGVGDVNVRGHEADLEIDLGVGDAEVTTAHSVVQQIELDAGVGQARLETALGEHVGSGFVGSHLSWSQDDGHASIEIDTGVGDLRIRLE